MAKGPVRFLHLLATLPTVPTLAARSGSAWRPTPCRRWLLAVLLAGIGFSLLAGPAADGAERPAWIASRFAGTPDPPPPYRVEPAFPHLRFDRPLDIAFAPGAERVFVAEQGGKIFSFPNDPDCRQADLAIDLNRVHPATTAVYALTFHPEFAVNRFAYICYIRGDDKPDGTFVSRFTLGDTEPPVFDPASERVIIRWRSGGHNGCCLKFGPDGYLYISTGDGAGPDPPDPLRAGQDVSNLLSAILRIDVDHADEERAYRVPEDNPFVAMEGARPEIWAYGFRNPWRMSFDRQGGDLWVGDVGWQLWEMIYRVERGGNYGWAIMEGPQPVLPEAQRGPTPILPPTVSHPHSEAASITGGFVYDGKAFPELRDAYIYGDYQTGKVWGLRHDGRQVTWQEQLAESPLQLVAFGQDAAGELTLLDYRGSPALFRLARNPADGRHESFPRRLSQTGLFACVENQSPAEGVIPYAINAPHWADHATSERWLAAPGTAPVRIDVDGNWQFPEGAVLAKTVSMELVRGEPSSSIRLETQILHREQGSWRAYTYRWNDEQTDAELVGPAGANRLVTIHDPQAAEGIREQNYRFSSRAECQMCHNPWIEAKTTVFGVQTASPLGVSIAQWNRPAGDEMSGGTTLPNQLTELQRRGWIAGHLPNLDEAARLVDPRDAAADLEQRARAYLHVNCAHCHQRHAGGTATIDLAYETPLDEAKLVGVRPAQGAFGLSEARLVAPGDPLGSVLLYRMSKTGGGRMPRVGSDLVDEQGVALLDEWIARMPREKGAEDVSQTVRGDLPAVEALETATPPQRAELIGQFTASTRGAWELLRMIEQGKLAAGTRRAVVATAAKHPQPEVRDLFERFLPAAERLERLGDVIDRAKLLALDGDVERGREVFFREGSGSCQSCHRVQGRGENLGPDLSQIGRKYPPHEMLTHLLEPSKFIEPKYVVYLLETVDGRVHSGLLVEKNDHQIWLKTAQNQDVRVASGDVELLVPQQKSLMPDLLLRDLSPQQAADLLAFLCALR